MTRLDDLENRSRRANLRILHIPEGSEDGKDPVKFMSELLMQVMGPDVFTAPPTGESPPVPDLQIWTRKTSAHIPGLFLPIPTEGSLAALGEESRTAVRRNCHKDVSISQRSSC